MADFDGWFSGFFDADGSITCLALVNRHGKRQGIRLRCSVVQHNRELPLLYELKGRYGGVVYPRTETRTATWCLDGARRLAETMVPLFDQYPLHTKKAEEWELVKPLILERAALILVGADFTTKGLAAEFWERVRAVHIQLSEGRQTWRHLINDRPFTVNPRGRPIGVKDTKPRAPRHHKGNTTL
jgi:LAGLIDADG endonuclease